MTRSDTRISIRAALATALVLFLAANVALHFFHQSNAVGPVLMWAKNDGNADSWKPMLKALYWLDRLPGTTLYQYLFFERDVKFQYPLSALLPLSGLKALGFRPTFFLLNDFSWVFVLWNAAAIGVLCGIFMRRVNRDGACDCVECWICGVLAALLTLLFYPVSRAFELGQIQVWINAIFAVCCVAWMLDRRAVAGIGIGLICLIKPQFSLFLLWGIFRKQWPFVLSWLAVVISGLALSTALYGLANMLDYLHVMRFLSQHGESYFPNQSVNGLLNRFFFTGDNVKWDAESFPAYNPIVYYGTVASSGVLILFALFWGIKKPDSANLMDFLGAALTFTIASPIAWEHHYGILPAVLIALLFCIQGIPDARQRSVFLILLGVAYFFSANLLEFLNGFASSRANVVQSYLFFAALLLLGMLYRLRGKMPVS